MTLFLSISMWKVEETKLFDRLLPYVSLDCLDCVWQPVLTILRWKKGVNDKGDASASLALRSCFSPFTSAFPE